MALFRPDYLNSQLDNNQSDNPQQDQPQTPQPSAPSGYVDPNVQNMISRDSASWEQQLREGAQARGANYDPTDLAGVQRNVGYQANIGQDPAKWIENQLKIYDVRGAPNVYQGGAHGGESNVQPYSKQFTDPITGRIEDLANQRANNLTNPPAGSGQALLEEALKNISSQFQNGGYTPGEQEILQTQAIDPLERLRKARKDQVLQQLSARGIPPTSGVAISMLQDVDRQFDSARASTQRNIAGQAAQERQSRMLQAVNLLGNLAGTQDTRADKAFQYQNVPLNLADRAWNQAFQLYGSNNPLALVNPLLQLSSQQQGQRYGQGQSLADLLRILTPLLT